MELLFIQFSLIKTRSSANLSASILLQDQEGKYQKLELRSSGRACDATPQTQSSSPTSPVRYVSVEKLANICWQ